MQNLMAGGRQTHGHFLALRKKPRRMKSPSNVLVFGIRSEKKK